MGGCTGPAQASKSTIASCSSIRIRSIGKLALPKNLLFYGCREGPSKRYYHTPTLIELNNCQFSWSCLANNTRKFGLSHVIILAMKYHIWTSGCQMNVADSQRVASALERLGYQPTSKADQADVIMLNTCVVRQSAEDKAHGRLTSLRPLKESRHDLDINLMGCMVGVMDHQKMRER